MKVTEVLTILSLYVPFVVLFVISIALEVYLAKRKACWPGLVLPICWVLPVLFVLPNLVLNAVTVVESVPEVLLSLLVLLLFFAPTLVLLAIYWFFRRRRKSREQVEKMKIQDL